MLESKPPVKDPQGVRNVSYSIFFFRKITHPMITVTEAINAIDSPVCSLTTFLVAR